MKIESLEPRQLLSINGNAPKENIFKTTKSKDTHYTSTANHDISNCVCECKCPNKSPTIFSFADTPPAPTNLNEYEFPFPFIWPITPPTKILHDPQLNGIVPYLAGATIPPCIAALMGVFAHKTNPREIGIELSVLFFSTFAPMAISILAKNTIYTTDTNTEQPTSKFTSQTNPSSSIETLEFFTAGFVSGMTNSGTGFALFLWAKLGAVSLINYMRPQHHAHINVH